jgi:hypothetical protein
MVVMAAYMRGVTSEALALVRAPDGFGRKAQCHSQCVVRRGSCMLQGKSASVGVHVGTRRAARYRQEKTQPSLLNVRFRAWAPHQRWIQIRCRSDIAVFILGGSSLLLSLHAAPLSGSYCFLHPERRRGRSIPQLYSNTRWLVVCGIHSFRCIPARGTSRACSSGLTAPSTVRHGMWRVDASGADGGGVHDRTSPLVHQPRALFA